MGMRITNKIMMANSMNNLMINKELQDRLATQMATGNKRVRPSDDPIGAIRSLRLSTNYSKLMQYNEKNADDADKWLTVTESAIDTVTGVLESMYHRCEQGVGDERGAADYKALLEDLKQLRDEVYANGDTDYAGRNLFCGFRTQSSLMFKAAETLKYEIKQKFTIDDVETRTNIELGDILGYTEANGFTTEETDVVYGDYKRIRLAYDNLDANGTPSLTYTDANGIEQTITMTVMNSGDAGAYTPGDSDVYYLADTGEIVFGKDVYSDLSALPAGQEFTVTYEKSEWSKNDLRPEHYFDCVTTDANGNQVEYEAGCKQDIYYDLGMNQSLKVNTTADEVFTHDIGRVVDDLEVMITQYARLEEVVNQLKSKIDSGLSGTELEQAEDMLAAAQKALDLKGDQLEKACGSAMTSFQGFSHQASIAMTNVGTRGSRLDLIKNRLSTQQDTFEELLHDNDKKEIEESSTDLNSALLVYEAALKAMGQSLGTSLVNYI